LLDYGFETFRKLVVPRAKSVTQLWKPLTLAMLPVPLLAHFREGAAMDRLRGWVWERVGIRSGRKSAG
jgi:hypothetical protein